MLQHQTDDSTEAKNNNKPEESPAIRRLRVKSAEEPTTPHIDFSTLTLEDGTTVTTKERVIRGNNILTLFILFFSPSG